MSEAPVRADGNELNRPLTEQSRPGTYLVITASRTLYHVKVVAADSSWTITRYPCANSLLLDGEPLSGVRSFFFDASSGMGQIEWWKRNVADRDGPDRRYVGTVRRTSRVMLILSVDDTTGENESSSSRSENAALTQSLADGLRAALAAVDLGDDFVELLTLLVRRGRDNPAQTGMATVHRHSILAEPMECDEAQASVADVIASVRELMRHLDAVPWPQMDVLFYMHGYDELHLALERLLQALERKRPDN